MLSLPQMVMTVPGLGGPVGGALVIDSTSFTQSLGSELLVNGSFASWAANNPNSWTVVGETGTDPEVSEVGTGQSHGGTGNGMANLFNSTAASFNPKLQQTVLAIGSWYEHGLTIDTSVSGGLVIGDTGNGLGDFLNPSTGQCLFIGNALATTYQIQKLFGAALNITLDNATCKLITFNALSSVAANGTFQFQFTLPASPIAGQGIHLLYRASDALNHWDAYIRYTGSQWNARLDSVVAGSRTNRINVAGVGTPNLLKVVTSGDNHDFYTGTAGIDGAVTQRGSTVTNSTMNTNIQATTLYSSAATPTRIKFQAG